MTAQLAQFAALAQVPSALSDTIRLAVADCFGCIVAGAESQVARRAASVLSVGVQGRAAIYGTKRETSPAGAALINAVAGHAFDLDDWEEPANTHPTVVILPACLAAAHIQNVTGADLLNAYAVGFEVIARLGEAVTLDHYNRGFHSTCTIGSIGAAAAVSRLLGLNAESIRHALSIAASQASGYTMQFGTNAKPLQAGFAARAGFESALLARAGATGRPDAIESNRGFAGLMGVPGRTLNAPGEPWALQQYGILLKPWPSCGYTHRLMTAALDLRPKLLSRFDAVIRIEVVMSDFHRQILPYDRPETHEQALFSVPACVAQMLIHGDLSLDHVNREFWKAPDVERLTLATRVNVEAARRPQMNIDPDQPDRLRVVVSDTHLAQSCSYPLGAPQNPMSEDMIAAKFVSNAGIATEEFQNLANWTGTDNVERYFGMFGRARAGTGCA